MTYHPPTILLADYWSEQFFGLESDERFVLLLVGIGCLTGVIIISTAIVGTVVALVHQRRTEVELKREIADMKRDMLDQGLSAEDIEKVIEAMPPPEDGIGRWIDSWSKKRKK